MSTAQESSREQRWQRLAYEILGASLAGVAAALILAALFR